MPSPAKNQRIRDSRRLLSSESSSLEPSGPNSRANIEDGHCAVQAFTSQTHRMRRAIDIPCRIAVPLSLELFQLAVALDLGVPMGSGDICHFQLSLFQTWKLRRDSSVLHVAARQQRLITALAIHGPRPRSYLVGLLWPESCEARAMESLRVSMHLVSRQVPGLLVNGGADLTLSDLVEVDLHRVRSCLREISQTGLNGNAASYLTLLRDAELLPGWYDDWVLFEQSRLRQDCLHAFHIIS